MLCCLPFSRDLPKVPSFLPPSTLTIHHCFPTPCLLVRSVRHSLTGAPLDLPPLRLRQSSQVNPAAANFLPLPRAVPIDHVKPSRTLSLALIFDSSTPHALKVEFPAKRRHHGRIRTRHQHRPHQFAVCRSVLSPLSSSPFIHPLSPTAGELYPNTHSRVHPKAVAALLTPHRREPPPCRRTAAHPGC